jgi:uncharacterized repeat protein (TIGR01451 family)
MKRWMIRSLYTDPQWIGILICLMILLGVCSILAWPAQAEGSRTMYPAGIQGHRGNIEWRTSFYGNFLRRRSLFKLYVEAGEVILLGSSAVGVEQGDILIYLPGRVTGPVGDENIPAPPDFNCEAQRQATGNPNQGRITSREQELAGPATITDTVTASPGNEVPDAYTPCFYSAPETGIYYVIFFGPYGGNSDKEIAPTGEVELASPDNFNARQATSVAVWDVTVRSSLTSLEDINGRLFADYVTQFVGGNPRPVYSQIYIVTRDGFRYVTNLGGLDPDGFITFANDVGFLDNNGDPLFHDVVAKPGLPVQEGNQLNERIGDTQLAPPTHLVFLNPPLDIVLQANDIPLTATAPELSQFEFQGRLGENDTYVSGGGTFIFTSNVSGLFQIVISRDGVDFDPTNPLNRVIRRQHPGGTTTVEWDGLDNSQNPFPVGLGYQAQMILRAGEHHFPILDPENSLEGGPTYELLNPPNDQCPSFNGNPPNCYIAFYDDRGYITSNGTPVGTPGEALPGTNPPEPPFSDPLAGFDTRTNQRKFGDGSGSGFGDKKGLDLWTFYPSEAALTTIDILPPNVAITKTDGGVTTSPGGIVVYTLNYSNTGPVEMTGVVITEEVPLYTFFNQTASAPTIWSCPDGSPAGTGCTTTIGTLPSGSGGAVTFAITVDPQIPAEVTQIENLAVIGDDGIHGPDPDVDNTAPDTTPLQPPPTDGGDGDGDGGDGDGDGDGDDGDDSGDDGDDGNGGDGDGDGDDGNGDNGDDGDSDGDGQPDSNGGIGGDGQPGDGETGLPPGATADALALTAGGTPAPTLPTTLLPETGRQEVRTIPYSNPFVSVVLLTLTFVLVYYVWWKRTRKE